MAYFDADPRWTYQAVAETIRRHSRGMEVLGVLLILTVVIGLFACGVILYVLIAPDAARIHDMLSRVPR